MAAWLLLLASALLAACNRPTADSDDANPSGSGGSAHASEGYPAKVDPVAMNGPVFEGWSAPVLTLVFTGSQQGYLEPCGCAGLENQKGGLSRRYTMLEQLRSERGWPTMAFDLGDQVRRFGRQAEMKLRYTVDALNQMQYEAVALGPGDLRMPTDNLLLAATDLGDDDGQSKLTCANIGLFGFDAAINSRWRRDEQAGLTVGVVAVVGESLLVEIQNEDIHTMPAAEAIEQLMPEVEAAGCDLLVLLTQSSLDESRALAEQFPQFQIVVSAGGGDEPPREAERLADGSMLIEIGHKGMYAAAVGVYDGEPRLRYQRVPLDARYNSAPAIHELLTSYQQEFESLGLDGLGIRPIAHPRSADGEPAGYTGAEACGRCHTRAYEKWRTTGHAHATETLTKLDPPRQFDPECLSCHVTGWNPQQYVPYEGGFLGLEATPALVSNGCENCHGPGQAHAEAESVPRAERDPALQEKLRQAMRLTKATAQEQACVRCHDLDNSPAFDFQTYWPKVEHPWRD